MISIFFVFAGLCNAVQAQTSNEKEMLAHGDNAPRTIDRETGQRILDEIRASPKPAEQTDLNTFVLASAHRERAASVQERTNGLWQSWLVSICQGCGADRMPAADTDGSAYVKRMRDQQAQQPTGKPKYTYFYPTKTMRSGKIQIMTNNLSNENIDQIRRDPNR